MWKYGSLWKPLTWFGKPCNIIRDNRMSGNGKEKKMKQIVLVAETGSDINPVLAAEYNIKIVPRHVSFDHETMEMCIRDSHNSARHEGNNSSERS